MSRWGPNFKPFLVKLSFIFQWFGALWPKFIINRWNFLFGRLGVSNVTFLHNWFQIYFCPYFLKAIAILLIKLIGCNWSYFKPNQFWARRLFKRKLCLILEINQLNYPDWTITACIPKIQQQDISSRHSYYNDYNSKSTAVKYEWVSRLETFNN